MDKKYYQYYVLDNNGERHIMNSYNYYPIGVTVKTANWGKCTVVESNVYETLTKEEKKPLEKYPKDKLDEATLLYEPTNRYIILKCKDGSAVKVQCSEKDEVDIYIGAALALARKHFGSNTKFMKWVDSHWKGNKPEVKKEEEVIYDRGQRVVAKLPNRETKVVGTILDYDEESGEYTIEWSSKLGDKTFRCRCDSIMRTARRANYNKKVRKNDNN